MPTGLRITGVAFAALVVLRVAPANAQSYRVVDEVLDEEGAGYTILLIWGSHDEMGFAMGSAMAEVIVDALVEAREHDSRLYEDGRELVSYMLWPAEGLLAEVDGIVAGVRSIYPDADLDRLDILVLNAISDYSLFCRSHSSWGQYTASPYATLSSRRLDYSSPLDAGYHHVLAAWDPDDGVRWVNLAWAGYAVVVSAVNEQGTQVSLHDAGARPGLGIGQVPRSAAARLITTDVEELPPSEHLAWAQEQLHYVVSTGTYINYFVPEGYGGVFTCDLGQCGAPRVPMPSYLSGEVLITTNSDTDGLSVPFGGEYIEEYYLEGGPFTPETHFERTGGGLHAMTVGFRGREDMRIIFSGQLPSPARSTGAVVVEWEELFSLPRTPLLREHPTDRGTDGRPPTRSDDVIREPVELVSGCTCGAATEESPLSRALFALLQG